MLRQFFFHLFVQRCQVTCGGCQKLQRKYNNLSWRWRQWATEVLTVSYWSVGHGERAQRGLTTQKGTRPSTSFFLFFSFFFTGKFWDWLQQVKQQYLIVECICSSYIFFFSWITHVVLDVQRRMQVLFIHNIWGCGWNGGGRKFCVCSSTLSMPQNPHLLSDTKDIFSFPG